MLERTIETSADLTRKPRIKWIDLYHLFKEISELSNSLSGDSIYFHFSDYESPNNIKNRLAK